MQNRTRDEHFRWYDIQTPPRQVPWSLRLYVVFGGMLQQVGWGFLCFSMLFVWVFLPAADWASLWSFRGALESGPGTVRRVEKTSFSEGGTRNSRGRSIHAVHYAFDAAGRGFEGVSYTVGRRPDVGDAVNVEYSPGRPEVSRIVGMRSAPFRVWVAPVVLIFPALGAGLVLASLRGQWRAASLLTHGFVAHGRLKSKTKTNTTINNRPVYKFTFEFKADDGLMYEALTRTEQTSLLQDEREEPLLYDPVDPGRAILTDALPGSPRINAEGGFAPVRWRRAAAVLILPSLFVVGNCLVAAWKWL